MNEQRAIAYFSMEIGLDPAMPTYSGGLRVLAGDTIRSAADLNVPMVAATLLHRKGYFYQRLGSDGEQNEEPMEWAVEEFLKEMLPKVSVTIEGRDRFVDVMRHSIAVNGSFFNTHPMMQEYVLKAYFR